MTDRPTVGPTDGRTDRPSYRDARTHLKMIGSGVGGIELVIDGFSKKGNEGTDRQTDRPSYRDARTHLKNIILDYCGLDSWLFPNLHMRIYQR